MSSSPTRNLLKAVSGRNPNRRRDLITTVYGLVLISMMLTALLLHGVDVSLQSAVRSPSLGAGIGFLGLGGIMAVARFLGPAALSPPVARWLALSPLPRNDLLLGRFIVSTTLVGLLGALVGMTTGLTAGRNLLGCIVAAGGGMVIAIAVSTCALEAQTRGHGQSVFAIARVTLALGAASSALAVLGHGFLPAEIVAPTGAAGLGLALVVLVLTGMRLRGTLNRVSLHDARHVGAGVHGWTDAAVSLDVAGVTASAELRQPRSAGSFPSRHTRASSLARDLMRRDVQALVRRRTVLAARCAACGASWLIDRLFGSTAAAILLAVLLLSVGFALTPRLRSWLASSALWRMVPDDPRHTAWALTAVPLVGTCIVGGVVGAASGLGVGGLALSFAVVAFMLRRHQRPDMELGQIVDTPMGALPLGVIITVAYGTELLVVTLVVGCVVTWLVAFLVSLVGLALTAVGTRPVGWQQARPSPR